jgi:hypothetical protein
MKKASRYGKNLKVAVYSSFEQENQAEYLRLARMKPSQRLDEFAVLQERVWGAEWTKKPMKKIAAIETVKW